MKDSFSFSAVSTQNNLSPELKEVNISGKDYIYYGTDNKYPLHLLGLYSNCSTLTSIIDGSVDYVSGEGIITNSSFLKNAINNKGETLEDLLQKITTDYYIFGGLAIQVIRNVNNQIIELIWLDFSKVRVNEDETKVFYSNQWGKSGMKALEYPAFNNTSSSSIYYYKGVKTRGVYPLPLYNSAIMSIETQVEIKKFHKTSLLNNFNANLLINFNSGIPTETEKKDVERKIEDKFTGAENSSKVLISFNENKESATEIIRLESDNFDEKYKALNESSINDIFVAFRAPKVLFGVSLDNIGFNQQEYMEAFNIYNKVSISPIQRLLENIIFKITQQEFKFIPYTYESINKGGEI